MTSSTKAEEVTYHLTAILKGHITCTTQICNSKEKSKCFKIDVKTTYNQFFSNLLQKKPLLYKVASLSLFSFFLFCQLLQKKKRFHLITYILGSETFKLNFCKEYALLGLEFVLQDSQWFHWGNTSDSMTTYRIKASCAENSSALEFLSLILTWSVSQFCPSLIIMSSPLLCSFSFLIPWKIPYLEESGRNNALGCTPGELIMLRELRAWGFLCSVYLLDCLPLICEAGVNIGKKVKEMLSSSKGCRNACMQNKTLRSLVMTFRVKWVKKKMSEL